MDDENVPPPDIQFIKDHQVTHVKDNYQRKMAKSTAKVFGLRERSQKNHSEALAADLSSSDNESDSFDQEEPLVKAELLSSIATPISGQAIFGFKTPKRKEALSRAAQEAVHSSKKKVSKGRQTSSALKKADNIKHTVKNTVHIQAVQENQAEEESDVSENCSDDEEYEDDVNEESALTNQIKASSSLRSNLDEYFNLHHDKTKCITSNKTLAMLQNPKMDRKELLEHLKETQTSHIEETLCLQEKYLALFSKWMFQLYNGFNILLYGLGSKRGIIESFRKKSMTNEAHLVINGFFPSFTLKELLNTITDDLLEAETSFNTVADQYTYIRDHYDSVSSSKLFFVIHNVDGPMLRSQKVQHTLSYIAAAKNIHVVASVDHLNGPLIWDQNKLSLYNWLWYDCTTYNAYTEETSYENSLLVQQSGTLALSSLTHVMRSLTPNARGIFKLLAAYQMEHMDGKGNYNGLSFTDLYNKCREKFLVNSDLTLRAQLIEFKDHKLIKSRKGPDGVEYLNIPLDATILQQYIDDN